MLSNFTGRSNGIPKQEYRSDGKQSIEYFISHSGILFFSSFFWLLFQLMNVGKTYWSFHLYFRWWMLFGIHNSLLSYLNNGGFFSTLTGLFYRFILAILYLIFFFNWHFINWLGNLSWRFWNWLFNIDDFSIPCILSFFYLRTSLNGLSDFVFFRRQRFFFYLCFLFLFFALFFFLRCSSTFFISSFNIKHCLICFYFQLMNLFCFPFLSRRWLFLGGIVKLTFSMSISWHLSFDCRLNFVKFSWS